MRRPAPFPNGAPASVIKRRSLMNELHPSIVALVSLAANIASNHPKQGLCQVERLKGYGVTREQIDLVVEIARHIRDESSQILDTQFESALAEPVPVPVPTPKERLAAIPIATAGVCCTSTPSGQSCC
jgi:hypothetical protein